MPLILLGLFASIFLPVHSLPVVLSANGTIICAESLNGQSEPLYSDATRLVVTQSTCSGNRLMSALPLASENSALLLQLLRNCTLQIAIQAARKLGYLRFVVTNSNRDLELGWMNTSQRDQIRVYSISEDSVQYLTINRAFLVFAENLIVDASVYVVSFIALLCVGVGSAWAGFSNEHTWMANAQTWIEMKRAEKIQNAQSGSTGERQQESGVPFVFTEEFVKAKRPSTAQTQRLEQQSAVGNNEVHLDVIAEAEESSNAITSGNTDLHRSQSSVATRNLQSQTHLAPINSSNAHEAVTQERSTKVKRNTASNSKDELSVTSIVIGVAMLCAMLLLLYFFYDYFVYVFIVFFALGSANSMYYCILAVGRYFKLHPLRWPYWCQYRVTLRGINFCCCLPKQWSVKQLPQVELMLIAGFCLALSTFWVIVRRTNYGWVLQDILGATLCINVIKTFTIGKLKSITLLLSLLVVYDVFMVFLSPFLVRGIRSLFMLSVTDTPLQIGQSEFIASTVDLDQPLLRHKREADKDSVMIDVVTGSSGNSGEQVPLVFRVPLLLNSLYYCPRLSWTMLGFGDVIIPGLLIAFVFKFERVTKTRVPYFLITFGGYVCGLVICYVSAFAMRSGQPALLFIIPLTLLPVLAIAALKSHLNEMWTGSLDRNLPLSAKLELAMNLNGMNHASDDGAIALSEQSVGQSNNSNRYNGTNQNAAQRESIPGKTNGAAVQLFSADNEDRIDGSLDLDDQSTAESRNLLRNC